jgi:hypothetical protein
VTCLVVIAKTMLKMMRPSATMLPMLRRI